MYKTTNKRIRFDLTTWQNDRPIYLFIIGSYTKYKINRKTDTESEKKNNRKQLIQLGYNPTHTLENRSTISSHVNRHAELIRLTQCRAIGYILFIYHNFTYGFTKCLQVSDDMITRSENSSPTAANDNANTTLLCLQRKYTFINVKNIVYIQVL